MDKVFIISGAILGIIAGILLLICGTYNMVTDIIAGKWSAFGWMILSIFGGWFIDLGTNELKKRRE